ncbi:hypothetical protein SRIMM317S_04707 [Streptomyces rimosus subsp. rimosus]
MQVLDDHDERPVGGEALQEPGGQLEEAGAALLVVAAVTGGLAELGQDAGQFALLAGDGGGQFARQLGVEQAQDRGEGGERQALGADLDAAADGGQDAVGPRGGRELLDEPGLADPRLTADEQRPGLARLLDTGESAAQRVQLAATADEHRTDGPGFHVAEHRTGV